MVLLPETAVLPMSRLCLSKRVAHHTDTNPAGDESTVPSPSDHTDQRCYDVKASTDASAEKILHRRGKQKMKCCERVQHALHHELKHVKDSHSRASWSLGTACPSPSWRRRRTWWQISSRRWPRQSILHTPTQRSRWWWWNWGPIVEREFSNSFSVIINGDFINT